MNTKRGLALFTLTITLSILFITLVSAQFGGGFSNIDLGEGVRQIIDQGTRFLVPIFELLLGPNSYSGSELFFTQVMILILLFVVVFMVLERLPLTQGYRGISMTISLVISLLAVRFMSQNDIILGVVVTTLLPFLVLAYGTHHMGLSGMGRRIVWGFVGIVFMVLWIYSADSLGTLANYIYIFSLIGVIIMFIFDRRISAYFRGEDIRRFESESKESEINTLQGRLRYLIDSAGPNPSQTNLNERRRIVNRLRRLGSGPRSFDY